MNQWRKALIAASVGSVAALGMVALTDVPAAAALADLVVEYDCTASGPNSIVRNGPVRLTTNLTFATDLVVGDPLNFTWKLNYADSSRLQSPGYFPAGGQVHATGNVQLLSSWQGILQPKGSADAEKELRPDSPLSLPETMNDPGLIDKPGTITITPKNIELDFTPPDGSAIVNDGGDADNPSGMGIVYSSGWLSLDDRPASEHHIHNDLHQTMQEDATAELTFIGTGVEYIGPHDKDAGPVDIYIDGKKRATVDPSRADNDVPVNDDLDGGHTLWTSAPLKYGQHTIKIENASPKRAWLDAFRVITNTSKIPTGYHGATCKPINSPASIVVTVRDKASPTVTPSETPPTDNPPTDESPDPDPSDSETDNPPNNDNDDLNLGHVVVRPTATATQTVTPRSTGPTATKYYRAQVPKTPSGGVDTGEAPEENQPHGLLTGGMALVMGSAGGGLLLRRRRAAHAGGADA
ncbi:hypothetical protein FH608_042955 [Nonomuraea phyllanthi]|uniref:LPXTG cell wall anchor domain-containing protein n=1 Tax=Nonomuraea phyllanthi TaxID=2219224 RepID=A0A5C4VHF2_9ACTN|nr:hypothetical protein [Nonomuraea phyllanthi]KAB8188840.1 hypothetical protein FH608_042955 [Nonomuraea phyllanthi]